MIRIRRGLDLPVRGQPEPRIDPGPALGHVALVATVFRGLRPKLAVSVGDRVRVGSTLWCEQRDERIRFTSPGAGEIVAVHRGERRRLLSVVVRLDGDAAEEFPRPSGSLGRDALVGALLASGLWTALRERPFGRVPSPDRAPRSIFVTAIESDPLAPDPELALAGRASDFRSGLQALRLLSEGPVRLCRRAGADIPGVGEDGVQVHDFDGPHPSGLPGTHIHFLDPVGEKRFVWHIDAADVAAVGELLRTGRRPVERIVAIAGPGIERPGHVRTRAGASSDDLLAGHRLPARRRVVAGSLLSGRAAEGPLAFLGPFDRQLSVVSEAPNRRAFDWLRLGRDRFSILPVFASFLGRRRFDFTTARYGEPRAIVPLRVYEKVMPLDIEPVPLLKALEIGDIERAVELGCLELVEEDLALCSFVCPGKLEHGARLRAVLDRIEEEG